MNKGIPTIKKIAERLNVSASTVSRALNNHPRIGLQTRTRVQQLAGELNYQPNAQAVFFKQRKTFLIGVVVPSVREEFFSQAISGIEMAAMQHNYTILFGQSYDDPATEKKVVEAMRKQRVDGLLISLSKHTRKFDHLHAIEKMSIPVVYFDRVPPLEKANKVFCNLHDGTMKMMHWLISHGYRRIALINGPEELAASRERLRGYIDGLAKKRLKADMRLVVKTDFSKEQTIEAIRNLLSLKNRPEAIISFNDYVHMDVVQYARQGGIDINKDIVFASYANLPITAHTAFPPLISLEQYPYGQGEMAMQMIMRVLEQKTTTETKRFYSEELPAMLITHAG